MQPRLAILTTILAASPCCDAASVTLPTIDLIEISTRNASLPHSYTPGGNFLLIVEESTRLHLSTGDIGIFGAGGSSGSVTTYASAAQLGGEIRYSFNPISGGRFFERASFSTPLPWVRTGFRLDLLGPITLTAQQGSFDAVLSGTLRVAYNGLQAPFLGTDEALLGAKVGEQIPFTVTYTRLGSPWSVASFSAPFNYTLNAQLVTAAIPEPETTPVALAGLALAGWARRRRAPSA